MTLRSGRNAVRDRNGAIGPDHDEARALAGGQSLTLESVAAEVLVALPEPSGPPNSVDP